MKFLNIVKDGVKNVVDEAMFEAVYKPIGWKIESESKAEIQLMNAPDDEIKIKNLNRMKSASQKKFDDNLIKEQCNGTI